ncbi:hypothetical protein EDD86DRAFT_18345 [Gorgonomyces haynaldii]|nr:hypothetical protein EDD86DRAFT_18345 [Gorgonomyces haynaldii]
MPKILVLFVHGFMGSETSFASFPLDTLQMLREFHQIEDLEARVVPRFESKGDITKAVHSLHNWLLMNATMPEYEGVIIIAHSMGGLIGADALLKLLNQQQAFGILSAVPKPPLQSSASATDDSQEKASVDPTPQLTEIAAPGSQTVAQHEQSRDASDQPSTPNTDKPVQETTDKPSSQETTEKTSWYASWFTKKEKKLATYEVTPEQESKWEEETTATEEVEVPKNPPFQTKVNVIALICYDSPFFGLNSTVFTVAAGQKASNMIEDYFPPESATRKAISNVGSGIQAVPSAIASGAQATVSTLSRVFSSTVKTSSEAIAALPSAASSAYQSIPPMQELPHAASSTLSSAVSSSSNLVQSAYESTKGLAMALPGALYSAPNVIYSSSLSLLSSKSSSHTNLPETHPEGTSKITEIHESDDQPSQETQKPNLDDKQLAVMEKQPEGQTTDGLTADGEMASGQTTDGMAAEETEGKPKQPELLPIPRDTDYTGLLKLGLTTAVVATGAYYAGGGLLAVGSYTFVRNAAIAFAVTHGDEVRKHVQFLFPIWGESLKDQETRIRFLSNLKDQGKFEFKCFYVDV